jgi:hypothetical protein
MQYENYNLRSLHELALRLVVGDPDHLGAIGGSVFHLSILVVASDLMAF